MGRLGTFIKGGVGATDDYIAVGPGIVCDARSARTLDKFDLGHPHLDRVPVIATIIVRTNRGPIGRGE